MEPWVSGLLEILVRYVGQTVTIFTASGGLSGSGFTGVLLCADLNTIHLLTDMGEFPACPVGSCCTGGIVGQCGCGTAPFANACGGGFANNVPIRNPLGSVCIIPTRAIVSFTHNAIG